MNGKRGFAAERARWWPRVSLYGPLGLVVILLLVHVAAVCQDFVAAIGSPLEIDYGEGIVWQQAALIPGPSMYSHSQSLPFIVFHYPPLFHLLARAMLLFEPNFLAAGRLVSVLATLSISVCVAGLVSLAARERAGALAGTDILSAAVASLLLLCLHAIHVWGMVMRVDATAIAFAVAGLLAGAAGNGRPGPTIVGLLLCLCAVFTKQTQVAAGIALFSVSVLRSPRTGLIAGAIAGAIGLSAVGLLQWLTAGGFLRNIIGYNINRFSWATFRNTYWFERSSLLVCIAILVSALILAGTLSRAAKGGSGGGKKASLSPIWADRALYCRALLLAYLLLSTSTLVTTFKSGSAFNYLFEWLVVGCAVLGVAIAHLARAATVRGSGAKLVALLVPVMVTMVLLPVRLPGVLHDPGALALHAKLLALVSAAAKPVASDNMTLLMQAGKRVVYEPAIVTELAELGRWDETNLVEMIKARSFAFILTEGAPDVEASRRTPAVKAAIEMAYPQAEQVGPTTRLNFPVGTRSPPP